jgi:hypothetical protein
MHSFTSCLMHCGWSTKNREYFLNPNLLQRLALSGWHCQAEPDEGARGWRDHGSRPRSGVPASDTVHRQSGTAA